MLAYFGADPRALASAAGCRLKARPCRFHRGLTVPAETAPKRAKPDAMTIFRTGRLASRIDTIPGAALILTGLLLLRRP